MTEIFKDIIGWEDCYQISNLGRVFSKRYNRYLKPRLCNHGYYMVSLCKNGKAKQMLVHRLIALHFIENPENKLYIDHINRVRTDNRIENLRWATHKENMNNMSFKTITKGGYYKYKYGYQYRWQENKTLKSKFFKTLELVKEFEVEHLKNFIED